MVIIAKSGKISQPYCACICAPTLTYMQYKTYIRRHVGGGGWQSHPILHVSSFFTFLYISVHLNTFLYIFIHLSTMWAGQGQVVEVGRCMVCLTCIILSHSVQQLLQCVANRTIPYVQVRQVSVGGCVQKKSEKKRKKSKKKNDYMSVGVGIGNRCTYISRHVGAVSMRNH